MMSVSTLIGGTVTKDDRCAGVATKWTTSYSRLDLEILRPIDWKAFLHPSMQMPKQMFIHDKYHGILFLVRYGSI